jgi:hypothetical protein
MDNITRIIIAAILTGMIIAGGGGLIFWGITGKKINELQGMTLFMLGGFFLVVGFFCGYLFGTVTVHLP